MAIGVSGYSSEIAKAYIINGTILRNTIPFYAHRINLLIVKVKMIRAFSIYDFDINIAACEKQTAEDR